MRISDAILAEMGGMPGLENPPPQPRVFPPPQVPFEIATGSKSAFDVLTASSKRSAAASTSGTSKKRKQARVQGYPVEAARRFPREEGSVGGSYLVCILYGVRFCLKGFELRRANHPRVSTVWIGRRLIRGSWIGRMMDGMG